MSSIGTLWPAAGGSHAKANIIRAVAAYNGFTLDDPESYTHYVDNYKPEFLAKFPHGKIPAFEGKDGFHLFEGIVITRYIAGLNPNTGLFGKDQKDAALIDQWVHLVDSEIADNVSLIYRLTTGKIIPYSKTFHTTLTETCQRAAATLDKHLATRTFFVGERITLADIVVAGYIQRVVSLIFDAPIRAKYPHLMRHMETVVNQPKLKENFGEIVYTDKPLQYVPPPKEKKEPKPAAPPPAPKAENKPKAKAEEDDDDDDEPLVPAEPKVKNPLDDLPKSTFNLEDWKRAYSNKETRGPGGALEWFYSNFDSEGFSIWRVDFKYNEELTLVFMSSNQIGGFFNRLEASRKYLFGSMGVLGEHNNSVITGTFILRGQDVKAVVDVAPDWDSYEFTRIDLADEAQKAYFEAALAWDLERDGKKWADGKNFK